MCRFGAVLTREILWNSFTVIPWKKKKKKKTSYIFGGKIAKKKKKKKKQITNNPTLFYHIKKI